MLFTEETIAGNMKQCRKCKVTMQTWKLGGDLVACIAMAMGRNMEQGGNHMVLFFYLIPRNVLCKPNIIFLMLITFISTNIFIFTIPIFDK